MAFLELFDETLDINSTGNYDLAVQPGTDAVSFTLFDRIRNKFIMLRSYEPDNKRSFTWEQVGELFEKDDFLKKKYRSSTVILASAKSTLIPAPLFDPAKKEEYFSFNHAGLENSVIFTNRISDPDSMLLFGIQKPMNEILKEHFQDSLAVHHLKPLFELIYHSGKSAGEHYIHAHIESDFFNLIIYNNHKLQLCNSFIYRNISDIIYHILNVFRSMNIRQDETIVLSGNVERFDDLYSNLSLYIKGVSFAEPAGNFSFSYVFNETALHRYINLFNSANCVS